MQALVFSILQLSATLLMGARHSTSISPALKERAIMTAHEGVTIAQYAIQQKFQPTHPQDLAPNIEKLRAAEYLQSNGTWAHSSNALQLDEEYSSFGDLDKDNLDDAATLQVEARVNQTPSYSLVVLVNIAGPLAEVAKVTLGGKPTIYSHKIENGVLTMDMQKANESRKVASYVLVKNQLLAQ